LSEHSDESLAVGNGAGSKLGDVDPIVVAAAGGGVRKNSVANELIQLPLRYQRFTTRRQLENLNESAENNNSTTEDDTNDHKQCSSNSAVDQVDGESLDDRERDQAVAIQWIRQEIRSLKVQDRAIMRQLFELGTTVRRLNGALNETISCQTVAAPAQQALDVISDVTEDDVTTSDQNYESPEDGPRLDSQCRAVSMVTVNRRPSSTKTKFSTPSIVQRLRARFHRSVDQFVE
jgi:hypothetical protein